MSLRVAQAKLESKQQHKTAPPICWCKCRNLSNLSSASTAPAGLLLLVTEKRGSFSDIDPSDGVVLKLLEHSA
jgi:hypothetical protein